MDNGPNVYSNLLRWVILTPALGLLLLAGCETAGRHNPDDVLFGGVPSGPRPIPSPGKPVNAIAGGSGPATTPLPTLPPPGSSNSLASLATSNNQGPENDRNEKAANVTAVPDSGTPRGSATLHGPQPVEDSSNRILPVGATGASSTSDHFQDPYQQVMDKLKARGMTWMRLETTGESGQWKFTCTVADPHEKGIEHRYEASAHGEGGLAAMRAALEKMDHPGQ